MCPNEPDQSYLAYAIGYSDGLTEGVYNNPYDGTDLSRFYKLGYDKGVADYCDREHPEEV